MGDGFTKFDASAFSINISPLNRRCLMFVSSSLSLFIFQVRSCARLKKLSSVPLLRKRFCRRFAHFTLVFNPQFANRFLESLSHTSLSPGLSMQIFAQIHKAKFSTLNSPLHSCVYFFKLSSCCELKLMPQNGRLLKFLFNLTFCSINFAIIFVLIIVLIHSSIEEKTFF